MAQIPVLIAEVYHLPILKAELTDHPLIGVPVQELFPKQVHDLVLHTKAHLLTQEALEAHIVVLEVVVVVIVAPVVLEVQEVFLVVREVQEDPAAPQDPVARVQDQVAENDSSFNDSVKHAKM